MKHLFSLTFCFPFLSTVSVWGVCVFLYFFPSFRYLPVGKYKLILKFQYFAQKSGVIFAVKGELVLHEN